MNRFFQSLVIGLFAVSLGCSAQSPRTASLHRAASPSDSDAGNVHRAVSTSNAQAQQASEDGPWQVVASF